MKSLSYLSASSAVLAIAMASPAYAQASQPAQGQGATTTATAAAQSSENTDDRTADIVVTAQFRSQRLQDAPVAITAVNAEMLEQRGQTSIYQIAANAPNVTLEPAGQSYGSGMVAFIRGIGQYDTSYALEPGVGTYVDDVYYSTLIGSLLDLMDLDRVEVLRGPQGTLAGKNSIGGAIKLYTKKPMGDGSGSIQATYGSFNRTEFRGSGDFAIVPDKLFVRFSGASKSQDGYITRLDYGKTHPGSGVPTDTSSTNGKLGTLGGQSYTTGRVALRWLASPDIEVNVAGDYTSDKSEAGAAVTTFANHPATNAEGTPFVRSTITGQGIPFDCRFVAYGANSCDTLQGYNRKYVTYSNFLDGSPAIAQSPYKPFSATPRSYLNAYGFQGTIDWTLGDGVTLKSITGYRKYKNKYSTDEDGSPIPLSTQSYNLSHSQFSQELRLNADLLDGKLETTVGAFYFDSHSTTAARVDIAYTYLDFLSGTDKIDVKSKAAFGQAIFHVTDGLNLTGGIRYTTDTKKYRYARSNPDGTAVKPCYPGYPFAPDQAPNCAIFGLDGAQDKAASKRFDYRAVVDYRFSKELLAYAQFSTGFKGGGVNPYPYYGPGSPDNQVKPFSPETLKTYEVGFKSDLFDRRARINVAAFFNKYSNVILTLNQLCPPIPPSTTPSFPCFQPNNIGSADVKGFEVEGQFYPVAGLSLDGSFSYLDFKYKQIFNAAYTTVTLKDVTPYTPKYKWSAGIQYDHDIGAGSITGRLDGSYQSSIYTDSTNAPSNRIDSYFLANGRLTYRSGEKEWELSGEVQNIFNKYYFRTLIEQSYGISGGPGTPRTWAVTLKRYF